MASSGYGVETTVESIWSTTWDTAQFDFINILIGTEFNFYITGDAATDITSTKVTEMLKAQTHRLFARWAALISSSKPTDPWSFIGALLSELNFKREFRDVIKTSQDILYGNMELVTSNLPDANTRTY